METIANMSLWTYSLPKTIRVGFVWCEAFAGELTHVPVVPPPLYWSCELVRSHRTEPCSAVVESLPGAFALVSIALSSTMASRWAHEILHHGASFSSYRHTLILFVVLWSLLLL